MTVEAWLTLVVLTGMIAILVRDVAAPSVAVIGAVVALLVAGVVTPAQAFSGLSNPAPITVAALYVLARAVEKTGGLQPIVAATLGAGGRSQRAVLGRLLVPTAVASSVLNNTPIMAMLVPQVVNRAQRNGQSPSRFLMTSFASSLSGWLSSRVDHSMDGRLRRDMSAILRGCFLWRSNAMATSSRRSGDTGSETSPDWVCP